MEILRTIINIDAPTLIFHMLHPISNNRDNPPKHPNKETIPSLPPLPPMLLPMVDISVKEWQRWHNIVSHCDGLEPTSSAPLSGV